MYCIISTSFADEVDECYDQVAHDFHDWAEERLLRFNYFYFLTLEILDTFSVKI